MNSKILEYLIYRKNNLVTIKNTQIDMEVTITSPEDKGELYDILVKGKKMTQFYKDRAYINHKNPLTIESSHNYAPPVT